VTPARGIDVGTRFSVRVTYDGAPTPYMEGEIGREGFLPSKSGAIAQGQPDVAATWFPANDHPRDKATYEINLTVPSDLEALSNGVLAGRSANADGTTTWRWVENQPMASYLATAAIGNYRIASSTDKGRPVVLGVDESLPRSYDRVLARTPEVVRFLESQFGPYPFDAEGGIIHGDARIGFALENQTRPVYAPGFFAAAAGSGVEGERADGSWVLAHELAHQWYGDSVSVASWDDIWLNEGFATYAEWLWAQHEGGAAPKGQFDELYGGNFPLDPPGAPSAETMFSSTVYVRGAMTLEALRIAVGDEAFFRVIRGWAASRAYGNASTADFIAYAERASGKPVGPVLRDWLFTKGKPAYPKPL
jgi:aminopeptidase N